MKTFKLVDGAQFKAKDVLTQVLSIGTRDGINFAEMRQRLKIADKIDEAEGTVSLEDAEFGYLTDLFARFPFSMAHKELLAIGAALEEAT